MIYIGALILLFGSAFMLLAAIGVARLPDAFMRLHAATKSGIVGAGAIMIAAALIFGTPHAYVTGVFAVLFLLLTTPLASHLLGRAAYVSGAPLWRGTIADHLEGVLPRRWPGPKREAALLNSPAELYSLPQPESPGHALAGAQLRRILVVVVPVPAAEASLLHGLDLARRNGAALTVLSILDPAALLRSGPVPIGGLAWARHLADVKLARGRQTSAALIEDFQRRCGEAHVPVTMRHEEGEGPALVKGLATSHDLILVPPASGFAQEGESEDCYGLALRLLSQDVRPLIIGAGEPRKVRRIGFWHDGSTRAGRTLQWLAQALPWPDSTIELHSPTTGDLGGLQEAAALLRAHGRKCDLVGDREGSLETVFGAAGAPEVIAIGNAGAMPLPLRMAGSAALRRLGEPDRLLLLG